MSAYAIFQEALVAHQKSDFKQASLLYESLFDNDNALLNQLHHKNKEASILNYSSLLRKVDSSQKAIELLNRSLDWPLSYSLSFKSGAYNNLGNAYYDIEQFNSACTAYRKSISFLPNSVDSRLSLSKVLFKLKSPNLAYKVLKDGLFLCADSSESLKYVQPIANILIELRHRFSSDDSSLLKFAESLQHSLPSLVKDSSPETSFIFSNIFLAQFYLGLKSLDQALLYRDRVKDYISSASSLDSLSSSFKKNWNTLGWNLSIYLLQSGDLSNGWRLYDHGLQVASDSAQKWQRALKKPLNTSTVPLWRGQSLSNSRLLILGEQGIGDTLMFLSLLPSLIKEADHIYLYIEHRLRSIYSRSFPEKVTLLSENDLINFSSSGLHIDYQIPAGSICQYRFTKFSDYSHKNPVLTSNRAKTQIFRERHFDGRPLVGISWQGGGKKNIIDQKTVPLIKWRDLLSNSKCKFVSLQYGDDLPHLKKFEKKTGINVTHDDDVNSMVDMDIWLSQVDAMDFVISVANTTVHGAASLNKPTLCLLSRDPDWRWTDQSVYQGSYWYPCVQVAQQSTDGSWQSPLTLADSWLSSNI